MLQSRIHIQHSEYLPSDEDVALHPARIALGTRPGGSGGPELSLLSIVPSVDFAVIFQSESIMLSEKEPVKSLHNKPSRKPVVKFLGGKLSF